MDDTELFLSGLFLSAGVAVGDEVVLLGEGVTADDHARWSGTISYEILCGIRARRV
jgi:alanine racemase